MEKQIRIILLPFLLFVLTSFAIGAEVLDSAVETKLKSQEQTVKSQKTIDKLTNQTQDMMQQYRDAIRKIDSLKTYNGQLLKLVKQQKTSLNTIQRQLDNVEETQRSIVPLMLKMISTLEKFVSLDMPFLKEERQQRVAALKEMMDRPDATLPDKYRRIMEAYQIEMEYGRTIESYTETLQMDGQEYTVDVLRIGRLLMTFQTLDGELSGVWNKEKKTWEKLPSEYNRSIQHGIQIANKQAPPDLIKLPVQALEK